MEKDFDAWNEEKKYRDRRDLPADFFVHEGQVWWSVLGLNIGVEMDGKHDSFERPVIVLRVFNTDMILIVPLTSTLKRSPFYHRIRFRDEERSAVLSQLRVSSTKRLKRLMGSVSEEELLSIISGIIAILSKNETPPEAGNLETRRHGQ